MPDEKLGRATEFALYGGCGAIFLATISLGILWYFDRIFWVVVVAAAAVGFVLAGLFRERALEWFKQIGDWS